MTIKEKLKILKKNYPNRFKNFDIDGKTMEEQIGKEKKEKIKKYLEEKYNKENNLLTIESNKNTK